MKKSALFLVVVLLTISAAVIIKYQKNEDESPSTQETKPEKDVAAKVAKAESETTPKIKPESPKKKPMLSFLGQRKMLALTSLNSSRAKALSVAILSSGSHVEDLSGIEGYQDLRFQNADEKNEDWLYSPTGFGELGDSAPHGGNVILMAPRLLDGKLVMGCNNGSVYALPLEQVRERLDISKLKQD